MYHINNHELENIKNTRWNAAKLGRYLEGDFMTPFEDKEKAFETNRSITFLHAYGMFSAPSEQCPKCGNGFMRLYSDSSHKEGMIVKCFSGKCLEKRSAFKGLWFENVHMPLKKVIYIIYYWSKRRTVVEVMDELGECCPNTIVDHYNFLREFCAEVLLNGDIKQIGGVGFDVEIDESVFRKRKNHRGTKRSGESWVFRGVCRQNTECFLVYVPDRTSDTLVAIIGERIAPGTRIISDGWSSYTCLKHHKDYTHLVVNHSENFVDPENPECYTNKVEGMWHHAKSRLPITGTTASMQQSYLEEFMWRKQNHRKDTFAQILTDIGIIYHMEQHNAHDEDEPIIHISNKTFDQKVWTKVATDTNNVITIRDLTRKIGHGTKSNDVKEALKLMAHDTDKGLIYLQKNLKEGITGDTVIKLMPNTLSDAWKKKMNISHKKYKEIFKKGVYFERNSTVYRMIYNEEQLIELQSQDTEQDNGPEDT